MTPQVDKDHHRNLHKRDDTGQTLRESVAVFQMSMFGKGVPVMTKKRVCAKASVYESYLELQSK